MDRTDVGLPPEPRLQRPASWAWHIVVTVELLAISGWRL
jgi:hypothetical protein